MKNTYGDLPKKVCELKVECNEMMFYQYFPIKLLRSTEMVLEDRLLPFHKLLTIVIEDFISEYGIEKYINNYVYLTAKYQYQTKNCSYNREGWHSDGFLTDDINYIWSDINPTVFNYSDFKLTPDDRISLMEMNNLAEPLKDFTFPNETILRLNQFNIHKVSDTPDEGMRTFVKVSFSKDKYDLIGNSHNYNLDYNWEMKKRSISRNIPQSNIL